LGQKVHPIGFRIGVTKDWQAKWYADKHYTELLQEDLKIRKAIGSKYAEGDISRIEIERAANQVTVTVHTARPGVVIGRGGQRVDETRLFLEQLTGKRIRLNIQEVRQPEQDAFLVARNIAQQIQRRISHRRAMKQALSRTMESGAQGIKITCSGRLTGSEYSRRETVHQGRVPLHTLRADIDYAVAEAATTLGRTGVKVWIYKGDILPRPRRLPAELLPPVAAEMGEAEEEMAVVGEAEGEMGAVEEPGAEVGAVEAREEEMGTAPAYEQEIETVEAREEEMGAVEEREQEIETVEAREEEMGTVEDREEEMGTVEERKEELSE
jgi:small subunit ribosomal protein S3